MNTMHELKEQLIKENLYDERNPIAGCDDNDIELLRLDQNVQRLPQMYVEFARLMGGGAGFLFADGEGRCKKLLGVKSRLGERFQHSFTENQFELPDNAFIYDLGWDHFTYFLDDTEEENPVVYRYVAPTSRNPEIVVSFWDDLVQRYVVLSRLKKEKAKYLEDTRKRLIKAELERQKRVQDRQKREEKRNGNNMNNSKD